MNNVKLWYVFRKDGDELDDSIVHAMIVAALNEKDALEAAAREAATEHNQTDGWTSSNIEVHELTPGKLASDWTSVLWIWGGNSGEEPAA